MPKILDWLEVLNEQASWRSTEELLDFLNGILGRPVKPTESSIRDFQAGLDLMRQQLFALHFKNKVDLQAINLPLNLVRLSVNYPAAGIGLPVLRAHAESSDDDSLLKMVGQTLLVQFVGFLDQALVQDDISVARCEGLYREPGWTNISPLAAVPPAVELKWRREIPALVKSGLDESSEILRCADFFRARAKSRFCSDECRFRTFQISKQLSDPAYLANKQRRYRKRKDGPM